jgi:hypothetical protein
VCAKDDFAENKVRRRAFNSQRMNSSSQMDVTFPNASLPGIAIVPGAARARDEWFLTNGLGGFASRR